MQQVDLSTAFQFVAGGDTRFQSVKNGLAQVDPDAIVFVHDAVRCLLTPAFDSKMLSASGRKRICYTSSFAQQIPLELQKASKHHVVDRENVMMIQTPQTFKAALLTLKLLNKLINRLLQTKPMC